MIRSRLLILKCVAYGEADLIVHGLTPQGGRCVLFARAARKSQKRFGGGVLEPTHLVEVTYKSASTNSLSILQEARLLRDFENLRKDYTRLCVALSCLQTIHLSALEGVQDGQSLFNLIGNTLKTLETAKAEQLGNIQTHFEVKFLSLQGVLASSSKLTPLLQTPISQGTSTLTYTANQWHQLRDWVQPRLKSYLEAH